MDNATMLCCRLINGERIHPNNMRLVIAGKMAGRKTAIAIFYTVLELVNDLRFLAMNRMARGLCYLAVKKYRIWNFGWSMLRRAS